MAKKGLLVLVLASVIAGGVFAQENENEKAKTADVNKLWLSGELSLVGVGIRGEYMLTPNISAGLNVYFTSMFFLFNDIGLNAVGRFYPWGKTFYAGLGLGLSIHTGVEDFVKDGKKLGSGTQSITRTGFGIVPEIGWKIDSGKPGGFFMNPYIQFPITLGTTEVNIGGWGDMKGDFGLSTGFRVALGLGWAIL
ncbi:MAG: hypothetical protein LBH18_02205 [Spirochaetaceae bacterium]|jgi:hypothetical protein|nr:hypothetical protein [Spirochaetaceae bacterium]